MGRRLFVGINISNREILDGIEMIVNRLRRAGLSASFVPRANLHVSLKFLGDVPESRLNDVIACVKRACDGASPFELKIGGAGFFPKKHSLKDARVLFVRAEEAEDDGLLGSLALRLSEEFSSCKLGVMRMDQMDGKARFMPHITIARIRRPQDVAVISKVEGFFDKQSQEPNTYIGVEKVNSVCLKQSTFVQGGGRHPEYRTLFEHKLS